MVAGGVLAPAGDRQVLPAAVAAAGAGDHDMVAPVGQEVGLRGAAVGSVKIRITRSLSVDGVREVSRRQILGEHAHGRLGHPFLQEQVGRPQDGVRP